MLTSYILFGKNDHCLRKVNELFDVNVKQLYRFCKNDQWLTKANRLCNETVNKLFTVFVNMTVSHITFDANVNKLHSFY